MGDGSKRKEGGGTVGEDVITLCGAYFLEVRVWYQSLSMSCTNIIPLRGVEAVCQ